MINKVTTGLCLIMLLSGCTKPQPFAAPDTSQFQNALAAANFREKALLRKHPAAASRSGDILNLHLPSGKTEIFKDVSLEQCERETPIIVKDGIQHQEIGSCVEYYRVTGIWPAKSWLLVESLYYEGGGVMVVNATGEHSVMSTRPKVSPDHRRMMNHDYGCETDEAIVHIWATDGDKPLQIYSSYLFSHDNDVGRILQADWESYRRIRLTVSACFDDESVGTAFLDDIGNNQWVWSGKDPRPKGSEQ